VLRETYFFLRSANAGAADCLVNISKRHFLALDISFSSGVVCQIQKSPREFPNARLRPGRDEQSTTETETTMNELEAWTHFFSIALNALCTQGQGVSAFKGAEELSNQAKEIADEATVQWLSQRERLKEKERHGY
jgi:hypothetical protein